MRLCLNLKTIIKYFEEYGEFIFRTTRFHLDNTPLGSNLSSSALNYLFQNAFLNMLKNSAPIEQMENFQSESVPWQLAEEMKRGIKLCEIAEQYFDTLMYKDACRTVPSEIKKHVLNCQQCSKNFFKYSFHFLTPLSEEQQSYIKNITKQLIRHFSLISVKVSCNDVRSFLPALLDWRLRIKIPTPVTVHIDSCHQCRKDLETLLEFNFGSEQLERLSAFYSMSSQSDSIECKEAWGVIDLAAEFRYDKIPLKILEHICLCKNCRELLLDKRRMISEQLLKTEKVEDYPCEMITPSDLFDMAFPFGLDSIQTEECIYRGPFIDHITQCPECLKKINDVGHILYSIDEHKDCGVLSCYEIEQQEKNLDLSYGLDIFDKSRSANFNNWSQGAQISCEQVKRFLPMLADVETKIKVPDAAVAHIEQCNKCKEDIETIRSWKLDYKKNLRLSEFLSKQSFEKSDDCLQILKNNAKTIESIIRMHYENIDTDILNHVCLCRTCRDTIYDGRQKMMVYANQTNAGDKLFCENIKHSDLFDYVLPYNFNPANDEYINFRQPLIGHLQSCPRCLEKIRQMHNSIYSIAERGRLITKTEYEFNKDTSAGNWHAAQTRKIAENIDNLDDEQFETLLTHLSMAGEDPYKGWGIRVQIWDSAHKRSIGTQHGHIEKAPTKIIPFANKVKAKVLAANLKPLKKMAIAAIIPIAAVLLLYFFFSTSSSVAMARTFDEAVKGVKNIANVCIRQFRPGKAEPIQVEWVSKTLNVAVFKTGDVFTLWNMQSKSKKTKSLSSNITNTETTSEKMFVKLENYMAGTFGLMPVENITDVSGAQWQLVDKDTYTGKEIYELIWVETKGNTTRHSKFRYFFLDSNSSAPYKVEIYTKGGTEENYTLDEYYEVIAYSTDTEISSLIKNNFDIKTFNKQETEFQQPETTGSFAK